MSDLKKTIETEVTFLEMTFPPVLETRWPEPDLSFEEIPFPDIDSYRTLYHQVGEPHYWVNRRHLTRKQLTALLHHPENRGYYLRRAGALIGFTEVNARRFPQMEIVFVGLIPTETGKGLGRAILMETLKQIWERQPQRVIIETNTLDHPAAMTLYQQVGFAPYDSRTVVIQDPYA